MLCEWTDGPGQAFASTFCTCACACRRTALLLIGLQRKRHPSFQLHPSSTGNGLHYRSRKLHFLSVSKLIRCFAFTLPGLIPLSSSFLCKSPFPPICLCLSSSTTSFLLCLCHPVVFFIPLCIFSQSRCFILICTSFFLFSLSLLATYCSIPPLCCLVTLWAVSTT